MTNLQVMRDKWGISSLPVTNEHRKPGDTISTYRLAEAIANELSDDDVLVSGSSGLGTEIFQLSVPLPPGRDIICNYSLGAMGFGISMAIGACIGSDGKNTICVDGDDGFQLNVQELETIHRLDLPIKFFVLNNNGYASMRISQGRWFGRSFGADPDSGLTLPPLSMLATTYGLSFTKLDGWRDLGGQVKAVLDFDGPMICEVPSPPDEQRPPHKQGGSGGWVPVEVHRLAHGVRGQVGFSS